MRLTDRSCFMDVSTGQTSEPEFPPQTHSSVCLAFILIPWALRSNDQERVADSSWFAVIS